MEKISVIVPIYKVEKYLCKCIDSIINQTYKNLEIILVDDGSPDDCARICDEYSKKDKRINVIHKENGGVSSARNRGIEEATGEYIAFVDPDDWVESDMYEVLYNYIKQQNCEVVLCQYCINGEKSIAEKFKFDNRVITNKLLNSDEIKNEFLEKFIAFNQEDRIMGSVCRGIYSRKIILESNILFDEKMKIAEDLCFILNVLNNTTILFLTNEVFYNYRQNNTSVLHTYKSDFYSQGKMKIAFLENFFQKLGIYEFVKYNLQFCEMQNLIYSIGNKSLKENISKKEIVNYANTLIEENKEVFTKRIFNMISIKYKILFIILKYRFIKVFIFFYNLKISFKSFYVLNH